MRLRLRSIAFVLGVASSISTAGIGFGPVSGAASATPLRTVAFQTPSGNIHCYLASDGLRCDLQRNTAKVPVRPPGCELDWGNAFFLPTTGRAVRVCHGDTVADPDNAILAYGRNWTRGDITCVSAASGLTCVNRGGRSMALATARQTLS
jgi:hypothetical protein